MNPLLNECPRINRLLKPSLKLKSSAPSVIGHKLFVTFFVMLFLLLASLSLMAQDGQATPDVVTDPEIVLQESPAEAYPAAVTELTVADTPNDDGGSILVTWKISADDHENGKVTSYKIMRAEAIDGQPGEFVEVGDIPSGSLRQFDGSVDDANQYFYRVDAVNIVLATADFADGITARSVSETAGPVGSSAQWFHFGRVNVLVGIGLLILFILFYIQQAVSGKTLFIRKIAGLDAVDEAVGRATEMGRKIFYVPGTQDMDNVQTIAGISILGRVAEMSAQYETWLEVPVSRSLVMVTASEVVKEAYSKVGRPDAFNENQVHYLTDDQFGYAAAVDGMVVREKPATIFYMGAFYAESLILAETGNSVGAIQIAGTGMPSQLPFFVAACDYTLIGEELFAASAYLSQEPKMLGSLKGQDAGKGLILLIIIIGVLLQTFGIYDPTQLFSVN